MVKTSLFILACLVGVAHADQTNGCKVSLHDDHHLNDEPMVIIYGQGSYDLVNLTAHAYNASGSRPGYFAKSRRRKASDFHSKLSALEVEGPCKLVLYEGEDYQGYLAVIEPGNYTTNQLVPLGVKMDAVKSVSVIGLNDPIPTTSTSNPTALPTVDPTSNPTTLPTVDPTANPTTLPTVDPTANPTVNPTVNPTEMSTEAPSEASAEATAIAMRTETGRELSQNETDFLEDRCRIGLEASFNKTSWSCTNVPNFRRADSFSYTLTAKCTSKCTSIATIPPAMLTTVVKTFAEALQADLEAAGFDVTIGEATILDSGSTGDGDNDETQRATKIPKDESKIALKTLILIIVAVTGVLLVLGCICGFKFWFEARADPTGAQPPAGSTALPHGCQIASKVDICISPTLKCDDTPPGNWIEGPIPTPLEGLNGDEVVHVHASLPRTCPNYTDK